MSILNPNDKIQMPNQAQSPEDKKYDLEERTAEFGEDAIEFAQNLEKNEINRPLISQFVRSSTSIGANYMEADGAESRKDFIHKIAICKKESKETKHWLRMLAKANPLKKEACRKLWKEAHEFSLIFSRIIRNAKSGKSNTSFDI